MKGKTSRVLTIYLLQDSLMSKKVIRRAQKVNLWGSSHEDVSCWIIILDTTFKTLIYK